MILVARCAGLETLEHVANLWERLNRRGVPVLEASEGSRVLKALINFFDLFGAQSLVVVVVEQAFALRRSKPPPKTVGVPRLQRSSYFHLVRALPSAVKRARRPDRDLLEREPEISNLNISLFDYSL